MLPRGTVFHSDLTLTDGEYDSSVIKEISKSPTQVLIAVNVKGTNDDEWYRLTGTIHRWPLFWKNIETIVIEELPMYITFTGIGKTGIDRFWSEFYGRFSVDRLIPERYMINKLRDESYTIDLINYEALK